VLLEAALRVRPRSEEEGLPGYLKSSVVPQTAPYCIMFAEVKKGEGMVVELIVWIWQDPGLVRGYSISDSLCGVMDETT
jgi:hypothetical protein